MCVIAAKPRGVEMPQWEIIKQMWDSNKDGAGLMWLNKDNKVEISKGYMKYEDLERQIKSMGDLTNIPVVLHFRITTHGGTSAENTHPFPVSDNINHLKALDVVCNLGMAHNGTINTMPREDDNSDTQIYLRDILTPLSVIAPENLLEDYKTLIDKTISGSRLAFLDTTGQITVFGTWHDYDKAPGVKFSNLSFKPYVYTPKTTTYVSTYTRSKFENNTYYVVNPQYKNSYLLGLYELETKDVFYVYEHEGKQLMYNWSTFETIETDKLIAYMFSKASRSEIDSVSICKPEVKNNIGGKDNKETALVKMNANRDKLLSTFEERIFMKNLNIGTLLEGYDEEKDEFYFITVTSKNWFYNSQLDEILYMQKDGTLIVVAEVTIPLVSNNADNIFGIEYEVLNALIYYNEDAFWRKGE